MTSPVFIIVLSAIAALAVAVVLLRARAPRGGYRAWVREAYRAVRAQRRAERHRRTMDRRAHAGQRHVRGRARHARSTAAGHAVADSVLNGTDTDGGSELHVADLLGMSDEGPAYQSAVDLRRVVRRVRVPR